MEKKSSASEMNVLATNESECEYSLLETDVAVLPDKWPIESPPVPTVDEINLWQDIEELVNMPQPEPEVQVHQLQEYFAENRELQADFLKFFHSMRHFVDIIRYQRDIICSSAKEELAKKTGPPSEKIHYELAYYSRPIHQLAVKTTQIRVEMAQLCGDSDNDDFDSLPISDADSVDSSKQVVVDSGQIEERVAAADDSSAKTGDRVEAATAEDEDALFTKVALGVAKMPRYAPLFDELVPKAKKARRDEASPTATAPCPSSPPHQSTTSGSVSP